MHAIGHPLILDISVLRSREDDCNPFTASSIDASSYTHIVFSFASISATGTLEPWDFEEDIKGGQYQAFLDVKEKYPGTKTVSRSAASCVHKFLVVLGILTIYRCRPAR